MKSLLIVSNAYLRDDVYANLKYFNTKLKTFCIAQKKNSFFPLKKIKNIYISLSVVCIFYQMEIPFWTSLITGGAISIPLMVLLFYYLNKVR